MGLSSRSLRDGPQQEREMIRNQRGLVDGYFEEGQYESGIAVLDSLRSPDYKPSAAHIRQLLYISLYPLPRPSGKVKDKLKFEFGSPSKSASARQKRSQPLSPPSASTAALRLLFAFCRTNSPSSLLRALPCYPDPAPTQTHCTFAGPDGFDVGDEDNDAWVAKEAAERIKDCRNCWEVLTENFIRRHDEDDSECYSTKALEDTLEDEEMMIDAERGQAVVGPRSWPILDWLVALFEKDETITEGNGLPRHSPHLLAQIPPPRSGTGGRWDADRPLDIVFFCMQQEDTARQELGVRLLKTLINLTSTIHLDTPIFTNAVFARLASRGLDTFPAFLSLLSAPRPTILEFKLALCHKYLGYHSSESATKNGGSSTKPMPQKARPVARRRAVEGGDLGADVTTDHLKAGTQSIEARRPLPSPSEIFDLVYKPCGVRNTLEVKYGLLLSYAMLQNQASPGEQDQAWVEAVACGRARHTLDTVFQEDSSVGQAEKRLVSDMKEVLTGLIGIS